MKNSYTLLVLLFTVSLCNVCSGSTEDHVGHETSSRHDSWGTGNWTPTDSNSFVRDAHLNVLNNTYFNYSISAWVPVFTSSATYDGNENQLTSLTQYWNSGSSSFLNTTKSAFTYNGTNLTLTSTVQYWVNSTWRNYTLTSFAYNANNKMTQYAIQNWDTAAVTWVNSVKFLYTYDASNNQLTDLTLDWNTGTSAWDTSYLTVYSYDANNHVLVQTNTAWSNGSYNSGGKYTNSYDVNGNRIMQVYQNSSNGTTWANYSKDDYTYDGNHNNTIDSAFVWNSGTSTWDNFARRTNVYNGANQLTRNEQQTWTAGAFVNTGGGITAYDMYGNANVLEGISWNSMSGWYATYKDSVVFDASGNQLYELGQNYDTTAHLFINNARGLYWFANGTGISELNELNATLFPNPSNGKNITLQLNLKQNADVAINVYDVAGRIVSTDNRSVTPAEKLQLNCPALNTGTYLLHLVDRSSGKASVIRFMVN